MQIMQFFDDGATVFCSATTEKRRRRRHRFDSMFFVDVGQYVSLRPIVGICEHVSYWYYTVLQYYGHYLKLMLKTDHQFNTSV